MRIFSSSKVAVVVTAALILAACGGDDDTGSNDATDVGGTAVASEVASSQETPPAEGDVDRNATIVVAYQNPITPATFDPHLAPSRNDQVPLSLVYDTVLIENADGGLEPGLATKWKFDKTGTDLIVTIREDVVFHDGSPLTAEAIKRNIERAQTIEGSTAAESLSMVTGIEAPSDTKVVLHTDGAGAALPTALAGLPGMIINPADFDSSDLQLYGSGSGMYQIGEHEKDSRILYERFDDYWDPDAAQAARVDLRIQSDPSARVNSLVAGEVDIAARISPDVYDQASTADGVVLYERASNEFWHFWMNRSEVLEDELVRQAIHHAIDKEGIVAAALRGRGVVAGQAVPESSPFYNPEVGDDPYPYDPDRARELLEDAGYADGVDIRFLAYSQPFYIRMNELLQAQLEEVGFRVTVDQTTEIVKFFRGAADAAPSQGAWGSDPTRGMIEYYSATGPYNAGGHTTPGVEAALEKASTVQDENAHLAAGQNVIQVLNDEAMMIPIFFELITTGASEDIVGLEARADSLISFRGVGKSG